MMGLTATCSMLLLLPLPLLAWVPASGPEAGPVAYAPVPEAEPALEQDGAQDGGEGSDDEGAALTRGGDYA
jgi:hypothetical protein